MTSKGPFQTKKNHLLFNKTFCLQCVLLNHFCYFLVDQYCPPNRKSLSLNVSKCVFFILKFDYKEMTCNPSKIPNLLFYPTPIELTAFK